MTTRRYIDRAINGLGSYCEANYPTHLRAIEVELGLASGALTDPVDYVYADVPLDNRTPRVDVFEEGWRHDDNRNDVIAIDATVVLSFLGDADLEAGKLKRRQYLTAFFRMIRADRTLGGTVNAAFCTDGQPASKKGDSTVLHIFAQGMDLRIHEP